MVSTCPKDGISKTSNDMILCRTYAKITWMDGIHRIEDKMGVTDEDSRNRENWS